MKKKIQAFCQRILGFERYLALFAWFKIHTLRWDSPEQEGDFNHFLTQLKPTDVVLDIGANIGIMTVLMAKACPQGMVYSFEPIPENLHALNRMVKHFRLSHVHVFQMALGEEVGTLEMHMPIMDGVTMQGLTHVAHADIAGYEGAYHRFEVAVNPLDSLAFLQGQRVDAIKIDVENFEQYVLKGAKQLIATHRPKIYCELLPGQNRTHSIQLLEDIGYETYVLDRRPSQPVLKPFDPDGDTQHNFFFLHPERVS